MDLYKIEDHLNININVFSLSTKINNPTAPEDLVVEWVRRSREIHKQTMNLNLYNAHSVIFLIYRAMPNLLFVMYVKKYFHY